MDDHDKGRALFFRALDARKLGNHAAAETHLREALRHAPGRESIRLNLSGALIDQGKFAEALALCRDLTHDFPANALAWQRLSLCQAETGQPQEALSNIDRSLALLPDDIGALSHRVSLLLRLNDTEAALQTCRQALALSPDDASLHTGLGMVHTARREFEQTLACHQRALALMPGDADKRWNLALVQLMLGDYAQGWQNMEARWTGSRPVDNLYPGNRPRWDGQALARGTRLLVWAEQGLGDTLQCCRYLPLLADRGIELLLQAPGTLCPLLRSLPVNMSIVAEGELLPPHDCQIPLMSLPACLADSMPGIPAPPILHVPDERLAPWHARLGTRGNAARQPRVGLMWQGNTGNQPGLHRSMPLEQLATVLDLPLDFHCVSNTVSDSDRQWLQQHAPALHIHTRNIRDFSDTAALLTQLDLLITVDTSIAHLGPALNVPTWVLLSWAADWRWAPHGRHTPWYPGSRLFRQASAGDWATPVTALREALLEHFPQLQDT